ncbi:MAG: EI24 domain-containing protein, partial [Rickettsiales bacterium]
RRSVILSVLLAFVMIIVSGYISWLLIAKVGVFDIELLDKLSAAVGAIVVVVFAFVFYPSMVMVVAGFFVDRVAAAVEEKHYPHLPSPRNQGLGEVMKSALALLVVTLILNILLMPIYVFTFFVAGLGFVIFYGLNGYLLGREFFEIAAGRYLTPADAKALRRSKRWTVFGAGVIIAVMTTIPILNLAAPVVATAFMVHVFQLLRREAET